MTLSANFRGLFYYVISFLNKVYIYNFISVDLYLGLASFWVSPILNILPRVKMIRFTWERLMATPHKKRPYSELPWSAFSWIRTEYGEMRTRTTSNTDTLYTVTKTLKQQKYLLWTLNDVFDIAKEFSVTNESDDTFISIFEQKISFCQLYDFIKLNK